MDNGVLMKLLSNDDIVIIARDSCAHSFFAADGILWFRFGGSPQGFDSQRRIIQPPHFQRMLTLPCFRGERDFPTRWDG